jgi:hypothetical protein
MKQLMKIALGLVILAGMSSCDLLNVDVQTTLSAKLNVVVEEQMAKGAADVYPFDAFTTINPKDDKDVETYADKIKEVGIDGVVAEVDSVSAPGATFYEGCTFTISNSTDTATYVMDRDWPIEVGTTVTLEDLGGFYNDLAKILTDLDIMELSMHGTSSKQGVTVTIRVDIETTMTGSPF